MEHHRKQFADGLAAFIYRTGYSHYPHAAELIDVVASPARVMT